MSEYEARVVEAVEKRLFIDGKWVDAADGGTFDVIDPATGVSLCAVADATPADGRAARTSSSSMAAFTAARWLRPR